MISPIKETCKENDEYKNDYNETIKRNINSSQFNENPSKNKLEHSNILNNIVMSPLKYFENTFQNKDENNENNENNYEKFSFKYNNIYASPLYTNTETIKKSISSTLCYEPLYSSYDNLNENTIETKSSTIQDTGISSICISDTIKSSENLITSSEGYNINQHNGKISSDSVLNNCLQSKHITSNYFNDLNVPNNKTLDKNYTTINKLNFTSLSCEPALTYIQKDKFKLYNYNIMIDTNTQTLINNVCEIPCFYCRRKFDYTPFGIPVKYYPSLYILIDNSLQTSKYSFNYKENIIRLNKNEKERILNILKNNPNIIYENKYENKEQRREHKIVTKNFFETDGNFCSFNCMISFIEENGNNPLYHNSYNYLYLMYKQIFGEYPSQPFIRSPSWKLRKEYGGPLNDEDYSKFIQSTPIIESKQIKTINSNIKPELIFEVLI